MTVLCFSVIKQLEISPKVFSILYVILLEKDNPVACNSKLKCKIFPFNLLLSISDIQFKI